LFQVVSPVAHPVDKKAEALAVLESLLKERHRNVAAVRGLLDDVTGMSRLRGGS